MTRLIIAALLLLFVATPVWINQMADAASLSEVMVRIDRMKVNTYTSGVVCAKPTSAATEASVRVTFPTGFAVSTTTTDWAVSTATTTGWPAGAQAWIGIAQPSTSPSGQVVTFVSGNLTEDTLYCFNWTNNTTALRTPLAASATLTGTVTTRSGVPADIDTATFTTNAIDDDQIQVSATVPQTFTFELSDITDDLGTLDIGSVSSSPTPRTVTINTNSKTGWQIWARDANGGLSSATATKTISSSSRPSTLASGAEGYNLGVTMDQGTGGGTATVDAGFDTGVTQYKGGGLDTTLRTLVSSNGTAQDAVATLTNNASISALTPAAADYTDTITVVGAGLF